MISIDICKKLNFATANALLVKHTFKSGTMSAIYGPSGAGKTSLLKIIAGLITPETGYIQVNGDVWLDTGKHINLPPQQRHTGFVFQDYALFPNMTVLQNMRYAAGKAADKNHIDHLLGVTGLQHFAQVKPAGLSGGQQQRLALARALANKPELLLLDEPLSATDRQTREQLQQLLLQLQQEYHFTALLVSHDRDEVAKLTNHVLQVDEGRVVNSGTPAEIFGKYKKNQVLTGMVTAVADGHIEVSIGANKITVEHHPDYSVGNTISVEISINAAVISKP